MAHSLSHKYVRCSSLILIVFLFPIAAAGVVPSGGR